MSAEEVSSMDTSSSCVSTGGKSSSLKAAAAAADQYFHDESATVKLLRRSMNARVYLESSSTLKTTTPLQERTYTPFSDHVLQLISRYPLRRLLIRVGDVASSSSNSNGTDEIYDDDMEQLLREERARGPSGTSILASFVHLNTEHDEHSIFNKQQQSKEYYQGKYASLLRYLLDNNLFPPCGAPLDSIRVRKHGHATIVQFPKNETKSSTPVVDVESFLAADAATFCNPGIHALLLSKGTKTGEGGWGGATNNGACHPDKNWGLFDSLFSSSSATMLSDLLLRSSLDPVSLQSRQNKQRNSVWIDLDVSDSCYNSQTPDSGEGECTVRITRGTSYEIGLPTTTTSSNAGGGYEQKHVLNLSLGDLILGRKALDRISSSERGEWAWHPCPLSDSSRISLYAPAGYTNTLAAGTGVYYDNDPGSIDGRKLGFNALKWEDGHFNFNAPWIQIHQHREDDSDETTPSLFGIARTVQRPLGLSSKGTLVSVFRYDKSVLGSQSSSVKVEALDVLPGTLIKPKIHTMRMVLYEGGGAGKDRFIPPLNTKDCSSNQASMSMRCRELMLTDLQDHTLVLNSDGSWLIERTVLLKPDSSLWMMVDFDEAYLPFQKFPADANRGIDTFPSRAKFTVGAPTTLYSSSILLLPPVPDMSMPFNVISLSCTLWAFVLGSLLNILVRRATESVKTDFTGLREKRPIDKLKDKLKSKVARLKGKFRKERSS